MTLDDFQLALSDLIASPALCLLLRANPEEVLSRYELSSRERRRLVDIVGQRGMSTSCTLYRMNRITPVFTLLPLTCFLLGDALVGEMELFWKMFDQADLQFKGEVERFADFLRSRVEAGEVVGEFLPDVLAFELAVTELRYKPHGEVVTRQEGTGTNGGTRALTLHPLVKVIKFNVEPLALLQALADRQSPPADLSRGEHYLVLDARRGRLEMLPLELKVGRLMLEIERGAPSLSAAEARTLIKTGAVI